MAHGTVEKRYAAPRSALLLGILAIISLYPSHLLAEDNSNASKPATCLYGTLPGILAVSSQPGERWTLLSKTCPLKNYITDLQSVRDTGMPEQPSILFLSDSMDFQVLSAFCTLMNGTIDIKSKHHTYNTCIRGNIRYPIGQVYLPTLTPQKLVSLPGNYQQGKGRNRRLAGYRAKMGMARANWSLLSPGSEPTLVVMGGGLWDIFRWLLSPDPLPEERRVREDNTIDMELLRWWMERAREAIRHARKLFPHSHFVWRNFAMPAWNPETGRTRNKHLGAKEMVVEMKAAGWQVAMEEGLELMDVAALVEEFPKAEQYLKDHHHPGALINLELLNVLLNIAHRQMQPSDSEEAGQLV